MEVCDLAVVALPEFAYRYSVDRSPGDRSTVFVSHLFSNLRRGDFAGQNVAALKPTIMSRLVHKTPPRRNLSEEEVLEVIYNFTDCLPQLEIGTGDLTNSAGWFDISEIENLINGCQKSVQRKLADPPQGSFRAIQAIGFEAVFSNLRTIADPTSSRAIAGKAIYDLLSHLSTLIHITAVGMHDLAVGNILRELRAAVGAKGKVTMDDVEYALVHYTGSRPRGENAKLYEAFDKIQAKFKKSGVSLKPQQILEKYEANTGRKLPFLKRDRIIASYVRKRGREKKKQ